MKCRLLLPCLLAIGLPSCGPSWGHAMLPLYLPKATYLAVKSSLTKEAGEKAKEKKKTEQAEKAQREADEQRVIHAAGSGRHSDATRRQQ